MLKLTAVVLSSMLATGALGWTSPFAFTYTDEKKGTDFFEVVEKGGYKRVYIYAGDVETYCRGIMGSSPSTVCNFDGSGANSFVYYTDYAQTTVKKYHDAGYEVYLNFDGRIGDVVADFGKFTDSEVSEFAAATAKKVCEEPLATGMGWDVEPYNANQIPFFSKLSAGINACGKRWGIFAFPSFSPDMWATFGKGGFVMVSGYDLGTPCECATPAYYQQLLTSELTGMKASAAKYNVDYQIFLGGSGTTNLYEAYTGGSQCLGGGPVYNYTCPNIISDWMVSAVKAMDAVDVKSDTHFMGLAIYDYTDSNNGGFTPTNPSLASLDVLKELEYWNATE